MAIVFFDIDGTLARGTHVPQSAAHSVEQARKAGHLVFICTGRPRGYAESTFGAYADGFVCCNGRLAVCNGERIIDKPLTGEQLSHICETLDELGVGYAFFSEDALYYGGNPAYRHIAEEVHGVADDMEQARAEARHLYSFDVFFGKPSDRLAVEEALKGVCLVNPHGPHPSVDVTVLGYGKGDAVRDVVRTLGMATDQSYAFGDGVNDISMLEAAGHGVAMGNAVAELKRVAEFVTTSIDCDGVANGLAHYGLF